MKVLNEKDNQKKENQKIDQPMVAITVNGQPVLAAPGQSILNVVHGQNLDHIPTLCHDQRIEPYGSCFLCVVEVEGLAKLVPSCCTPINPGMAIKTNTQRVVDARKTALELLLSNHYADCIGPCMNNCPAHVDAQGYLALTAMGKHDEALQLIKQQNPLPLSIGRVCVRDCEVACRRQLVDEPVSINSLKRYVADLDARKDSMWNPTLKARNGKKVAVVGGGPSGLSCAYYLNIEGYEVTIFEKLPHLGGMLMYGIPEYRLPKAILGKEIQWILNQGITAITGKTMGKDFDIPGLFADGFHAVYLAVGAHKASTMRIPHENDTQGVMWGIHFLRQAVDQPPKLSDTVIVVGGGNTAIDAARTALRCGADKVKIVYRRSIDEMPAHSAEIEAAQHEGIEILFLTNPVSIHRDENNNLTGIRCIRMRLEEAEPGQRPRPVPVDGSEFDIPCRYLIGAIGQQVDISFTARDKNLDIDRSGTVNINKDTYEASIKGVFSGGDVVTGPFTAISAIAQGKSAALSIKTFLETGKTEKIPKSFWSFKHIVSEISEREYEHIEKVKRESMPELPAAERINNFREVETGFTPHQAQCEPSRCLSCGCTEFSECQLREYSDLFHIDIERFLGRTRKYAVDYRHPLITLDPNKCINCGRCVRTCSEILEVSALGFVHRGFNAVVKPAMEKALLETNCIACGNCIDTCPTGSITEKMPRPIPGTLPRTDHLSVCHFCSIGCTVNVKVVDRDLYYVSNQRSDWGSDSINNGYLCIKGRFGHHYLTGPERLDIPMLKINGKYEATDWTNALETAARGLRQVIAEHGQDAVAVFGSPYLSNQELYLLQKCARLGLKNNNVASLSHVLSNPNQFDLDHMMGNTKSSVSINDIGSADIVVVVNGHISEENLILELKIKEAQRKNNARLVLINSGEVKLTKFADLWVDARRGTSTAVLNGVMNHLIEKTLMDEKAIHIAQFAGLKEMLKPWNERKVTHIAGITTQTYRELLEYLSNPNARIVFIYNIDSPIEKSVHDLQAIGNYLLLTGRYGQTNRGGLLLMREHANDNGVLDMGLTPQYLPGRVKLSESGEILRISNKWNSSLTGIFNTSTPGLDRKLLDGSIKGALVVGEDPLAHAESAAYFKNCAFLVVMDTNMTATASEAHVVLPAASPFEQHGTYTSCDHRSQDVQPVFPVTSRKENWTIIQDLSRLFNPALKVDSFEQIDTEIQEIVALTGSKEHGDTHQVDNLAFSIYTEDITPFAPALPPIVFRENFYKVNIKDRLMV